MGNCLTIVGLQWGDEGKGKVTDLLARDAHVVARYQGGANAGHTVVVGGRKVVLHQVPSGALNPGATCVIGPAVVVDPATLLDELDELARLGIPVGPDRLAISASAHAVMPYHKALDVLRERARGDSRIGTTGRGIGPTYEDLFGRSGIRLVDLCDPDALRARLEALLPERNALLEYHGGSAFDADELVDQFRVAGERLRPCLRDTGAVIHQALRDGRRVLFESAQGTMLDILHGTYPFVTSSLTTAPAAFPLSGLGVPPRHEVLGVLKAYLTRVGAGPFPTEDHGELGSRLRERGGEYGATTGRPRRCGHLDLPSLRYAIRLNGATGLALMKMDVLTGLPVRVCTAFDLRGQRLREVPPALYGDPDLVPVLEEWPSWDEDLAGCRTLESLPPMAREFVQRLGIELDVPVRLVSTGSDRESTAVINDPWG